MSASVTVLAEELRYLDSRRRQGGLSLSDAARYARLIAVLAAEERDALVRDDTDDEPGLTREASPAAHAS